MRAAFAKWMEDYGSRHKDTVFLTGDLGYAALEGVRKAMGDRFINVGVSEQNMISMAAALARSGLRPFCYSIAPFAVFRPAEQIRVDVCLHGLDVKIIGNGGGYGYGIMGATHHAIEDLAFMSSLQHMRCYVPLFDEDVTGACCAMMGVPGPAYLRLNTGTRPTTPWPSDGFCAIRRWSIASKPKITVVALGPMTTNCWEAIATAGLSNDVDLFSVSMMPLRDLSETLTQSISKSRKLFVVEEHVARGGLAEHLSFFLAQWLVTPHFRLRSHSASGYPNGLYGSQKYHQEKSYLNVPALTWSLKAFAEEK